MCVWLRLSELMLVQAFDQDHGRQVHVKLCLFIPRCLRKVYEQEKFTKMVTESLRTVLHKVHDNVLETENLRTVLGNMLRLCCAKKSTKTQVYKRLATSSKKHMRRTKFTKQIEK